MRAYANGEATELDYGLARQLVAARYGQTPAQVDAWPAADFLDAVTCLPVTGPLFGGGQE